MPADARSLLRELLCIDTTNPPGREAPAAQLLEASLSDAGFRCRMFERQKGRPSLVARLEGPTDRPALVLLSHTDVVGVEAQHWTHDPFGGEEADGAIWGRGALDMKGVAVMHAESAAAVARSAGGPRREVIVVAVADEEAGGREGAGWLVKQHAKEVGFGDGRPPPEVLGEGAYGLEGIIDRPVMPIALGEKTAAWIELRAEGDPGHGALPPARQAPLALTHAVEAVAGFSGPRVHPVMSDQFRTLAHVAGGGRGMLLRALSSRRGDAVARVAHRALARAGALGPLLADSVTPTRLDAGYKHNVVPGAATASLDCRLLPDTDVGSFAAAMAKKVEELGVEVKVRGVHGAGVSSRGALYDAIATASAAMTSRPVVVPTLSPGITDVRHFRQLGATGYGWVPLVLTPELLGTIHGHDERIPIEAFDEAVRVMTHVVVSAST